MNPFAVLEQRLEHDGVVRFSVRVRVGTPSTQVVNVLADGTLKIDVAAIAERGKANAELRRFLAEIFRVPQASVRIISGHGYRLKLIEVIRSA